MLKSMYSRPASARIRSRRSRWGWVSDPRQSRSRDNHLRSRLNPPPRPPPSPLAKPHENAIPVVERLPLCALRHVQASTGAGWPLSNPSPNCHLCCKPTPAPLSRLRSFLSRTRPGSALWTRAQLVGKRADSLPAGVCDMRLNPFNSSQGLEAVCFAPDGRHILSTSSFQVGLRCGDPPPPSPLLLRPLHSRSSLQLRVTIWSLVGLPPAYIKFPKLSSGGLAFSRDGKYLAVLERKDCKDHISIFVCKTWQMIKVALLWPRLAASLHPLPAGLTPFPPSFPLPALSRGDR